MTYIINAKSTSGFNVMIKHPLSLNLDRSKARAKELFSNRNIKQAFVTNQHGKTVYNLIR